MNFSKDNVYEPCLEMRNGVHDVNYANKKFTSFKYSIRLCSLLHSVFATCGQAKYFSVLEHIM